MKLMPVRKLGRLTSPHDSRQLYLGRYLMPGLAAPPEECDWSGAVDAAFKSQGIEEWPVYANDEYGCCVEAAACHAIISWTANGSGFFLPSYDQCLEAYSAITGFMRGDYGTDKGTDPIDCLKYWRGVGVADHTIGAWVEVSATNVQEIKQAIYLFGACYMGLDLPLAAAEFKIWHVPTWPFDWGDSRPGSWGGQMVMADAYDKHGVTVTTWGERKYVTWPFIGRYGAGLYAILSQDILRPNGLAPAGIDFDALRANLEAVGNIPHTT